MIRLVLHPGTADERSFEIPDGETTVGRTEDNGICVVHPSLSRRHAKIVRAAERIWIEDLGSKNGVCVNGVRAERAEVRSGDSVRMGDLVFSVGAAPSEKAAAPTRTKAVELAFMRATRIERSTSELADRITEVRARERLSVLLQVGQILSSPEPIAVLLEKVLDLAFQILGVDRAAVLLARPDGTLEPRVIRTRHSSQTERIWSQSIVDFVRERGVAALFADAKADPRIDPTKSVLFQSIRSSMCAPLKTAEATLGVVYVDTTTGTRVLTDDDLDLFAGFANQAAVALENATLHERIAEEAALRRSLVRFFPPATVQRILDAKGAGLGVVEAEVTALFCDISGFTAMSARMEPREVLALLNEYFPLMADVVFRHEGTLEKYIGDALLAVWGAPFAHDDDADRALCAAVEMQRAAVGKPFRIHVGLHTGRVAAGNVGSDRYVQYATVGDTTNIASRVCGGAAEGEILVSGATAARLRDKGALEPRPPLAVKGRDEPLEVHRARWDRPQ